MCFCVYVTLQLLSRLFDLIAFYLDSTYVGIYCFHFYSFVITHCKPASYYALPISVGIPKWNEYFHIASHIHKIRILSFTVDTAHCFAIHRFQSCEYWNSSGCVCVCVRVYVYVYLERKTRWMKNLFRLTHLQGEHSFPLPSLHQTSIFTLLFSLFDLFSFID